MSHPWRTWQAALGLLMITVLAYAASLRGAFVYDDFDYVVNNPLLAGDTVDLRAIFTTSYPPDQPEQNLYRPLVTLSYVIDKAVWGIPSRPQIQPNQFHVTNLLWHCATVLALLLLCRRLTGATEKGCIDVAIVVGVAFFAVHPLATESVAWVSGRAELMAACFSLAGLIGWVRWLQTSGRCWPWLMLAWLGFALALLCKENAIVLPALAALLQCRYRLGRDLTRRQWMVAYAGFASMAAVYLCCRLLLFAGVGLQEQAYTGITDPVNRLLVAGKVLARYLLLVFVPYRQSVFHDVRVEHVVSGLCVLFLVGETWWLIRRRWQYPSAWFGWCWFFVALLPVSNLVFPIGSVMAERFLYLPLIGWAIALMSALESATKVPRWLTILLCVVVVHHAVKTAWRGLDWRDERALWSSAEQVYPDSFIVQAQLGLANAAVPDPANAQEHLRRALELVQRQPAAYREKFEPRIREALHALSSSELEAIHRIARGNRLEEAAKLYAGHLQAHPGDAAAQRALADCYLGMRNFVEAARLLRSLLERDPRNALLHAKLGLALNQSGETEQARREYGTALELNPNDAITWANLGNLEMGAEDFQKAKTCFERAVTLQPEADAFRLNLAVCLLQLGQTQQAREQAEVILQHDPNNAEAAKLLQTIMSR